MALKKWIYKKYTNDGCSVYGCLTCNAQWDVRSIPTNYCPNCGIKFEGGIGEDVVESARDKRNKVYDHTKYSYIVESRHILDDNTKTNWEYEYQYSKSNREINQKYSRNVQRLQYPLNILRASIEKNLEIEKHHFTKGIQYRICKTKEFSEKVMWAKVYDPIFFKTLDK